MSYKQKKSSGILGFALKTILLLIILCAGALGYAWKWLHQPIDELDDTTYEVARGASVNSVARNLQQRGWLQFPQLWRSWAHISHQASSIKAGEYAFHRGMSPDDLLRLFTSGKVVLHSVQFIEGSTFADMRRIVMAQPTIEHTLQNVADMEIMRRLNLPGVHPEGQFFPDTYQYAKGTTDVEIFAVAQRRMQKELQQAWNSRSEELAIHSPYEALVLASIVEKETALATERPKIAGVFMDRLDRGMRLQTDPTVVYGLGDSYDGNIHKSDLLNDTPYNTYTRDGLPPTPICLPGAQSLQAATHPERTGALYFVATGEGGAHHFSKTYEEHAEAVARLIKLQRSRRE